MQRVWLWILEIFLCVYMFWITRQCFHVSTRSVAWKSIAFIRSHYLFNVNVRKQFYSRFKDTIFSWYYCLSKLSKCVLRYSRYVNILYFQFYREGSWLIFIEQERQFPKFFPFKTERLQKIVVYYGIVIRDAVLFAMFFCFLLRMFGMWCYIMGKIS